MTQGLPLQLEDCYRTVALIEYPDDPYVQEIHDQLASGGIVGMIIRKRDVGQTFLRAQAFKFANDLINDANRKNAPLIIISALEIERRRIWTVL